jgi:hypothetical protein
MSVEQTSLTAWRMAIKNQSIETWCNQKRRLSTLDSKTIEEFRKQKNNFKNVD